MLGNRNKEVMIFDMVKIMRPNQLLLFSEKLELFIVFFGPVVPQCLQFGPESMLLHCPKNSRVLGEK